MVNVIISIPLSVSKSPEVNGSYLVFDFIIPMWFKSIRVQDQDKSIKLS